MTTKKMLIKSSLYSLAITLFLVLVNLVYYFANHNLLFASRTLGGDCMEYRSIGLFLLEVYPQSLPGQASVHRTLSFDPVSFLITFAVLFLVIFAVLWVRRKKA